MSWHVCQSYSEDCKAKDKTPNSKCLGNKAGRDSSMIGISQSYLNGPQQSCSLWVRASLGPWINRPTQRELNANWLTWWGSHRHHNLSSRDALSSLKLSNATKTSYGSATKRWLFFGATTWRVIIWLVQFWHRNLNLYPVFSSVLSQTAKSKFNR